MASADEHRREAERLLASVDAAAGDSYHAAADHVPALLAALVHATLAHSTQITVTADQPARPAALPGLKPDLVDRVTPALPGHQERLPELPSRPVVGPAGPASPEPPEPADLVDSDELDWRMFE